MDMSPCDFLLFTRLKKFAKDQHFDFIEGIQYSVTKVLGEVSQEVFQNCYENWKTCWNKCIDAGGDYFKDYDKYKRRMSAEQFLASAANCENSSEAIFSEIKFRKEGRKRLIKLGEGIEIYEDQLRSVKWSDYRKLTRGLATILFSPAELATCSVTGQRWSRAGTGERPVKPALDRAKVQAIISYVATRFPMVEISRIKQVLAYKCKENSTAFKMKAVRYYGEQLRVLDSNS